MKTNFLEYVGTGRGSDGYAFEPGLVIDKDTAKCKFGGDPMAEYLHMLDGNGGEDDWTGSVEWDVYVAKFGKRLLLTDDQGFVWVEKYPDEVSAKGAFEAIGEAYGEWLDANDEEIV